MYPSNASLMTRSIHRFTSSLLLVLVLAATGFAKSREELKIYFIDVEGGQSTLVVSPAKHSLLIDAGFAGSRDAQRIVEAMKDAGVKKIDYLLITHFHGDHAGGVPDLAKMVKIGTFVDHGPDIEDSPQAKELYSAYLKALGHKPHLMVLPGQGLPLKEIEVQFLAAGGAHIENPLPAAGEANFYCAAEAEPPADTSENSQSLALLVTYGKFRYLDMGDLTEGKSLPLVCPNNLIGRVDLYRMSHHGAYPDNPKALVRALHPTVAVMNNGEHKGGNPEAWQIVHDSPGLDGLWQLHYAADAGKEHNSDENLIANTDMKSDGHFISVTVEPDGHWTIKNSRNGYEKTFGN